MKLELKPQSIARQERMKILERLRRALEGDERVLFAHVHGSIMSRVRSGR